MTYKILKINLLIFISVFVSLQMIAQNSLLYTEEDANYKTGVELFEIEKYAAAQEYFNQVIDYYGKEHTDIKADAEYYLALCSIQLFNADAEYRIAEFIAKYPESPRTRMAYFEMAKFKYRNKKYDEALFYFEKVWKQNLSKEQLYEFYFKKGYSHFKEDELGKSAKMFFEILNKDSKYTGPANYYYAHVAYLDKNYETALNGFTKLTNDPTFAPVVPYYIVQIYYLQGKNDKVLEYGPQLLNTNETKREAEISRLVGEALYKNERYQEALEFLETYKKKAETYTREDIYQLGYVYYMTKDYESAVTTLSNITNVEDGLTQNAYFHMADCYLKQDKKDQARMAFEAASKLDFELEVKEVSLLNYAKLSYELSFSPFNETIKAFDNYIEAYPNSFHHDEAYGYLVKVYLTSKNYKEALHSLEKIKIKSPEMMIAQQRVSFYRGLELFNNLQFSEALAAFEISLKERAFDKQMNSLAIYWKAEALYRLEKYAEAAEWYNKFLLTPGAYSLKEYNISYYNMGYCYFKQKQYMQAISWFRKYTDKGKEVNQLKRGDAFIRIADCYFVERKYNAAIEYYGEAQKLDTFDVDYAVFQKGFSYGLIKNYYQKNRTLSILINEKPNSNYAADALFERGRGFVALDSMDSAISDFNLLISKYPNSIYKIKTLLQLGLLHYSKDNYDDALMNFKRVVSDYPGTIEANDALLGIKNIYVDINKVDEYFAFAKEQGGGSVSVNEKDSLTYLAAEKIYMTGNWDFSKKLFRAYLKEFPNGKFALNAHYYRGDCYYRGNVGDTALADFSYVIEKPKNIFTEQSLLNAAVINDDNENDSLAYHLYNKLENLAEIKSNLLVARIGQMQAAFKLQKFDLAIEASRRVLMTDKVSEEEIRKARLIMGKSFKQQGLLDAAITQFRILALDVKNTEGAEGKYRVSEILFEQKNSDKSEETIIEFIDMGTPHQYWLAKAFLLWSDIYLQKEDKFQAKANLQSVIENYTVQDDGIIDEAISKLEVIVTEENLQFKNETIPFEIQVKDTTNTNSDNNSENE
ncbi:MAG: tetratricopeptide repeat protein [Salinivirgaceae bacterium]|nr:tetratricopeptide repeat protein [Salinivirgaceae bacterium]